MKNLIVLIVVFFSWYSFAQKEFHVFPSNSEVKKGSAKGDGSIAKPWDLQTALSQTSERINGGDIIWLHAGIYKGNFKSTINSTIKDQFITVAAYRNDKVVLNGNIENYAPYVLEVSGSNVIFKNFEVTFLGKFSRLKSDNNFKAATGINHVKGKDCKFQNIVIYNIPGSGFGSWKATGGTIIEDCVIYNNGYQGKRGHGVGLYVQNETNNTRLIKNNIIFNNYYKGVEVWSASSGSKREFVKNVDLVDNIIFNNGNPSGRPWGNLIIASGDREGVNVAKNINVNHNILYHNVDFDDFKNFGYGNSLTLGYTANALVEDISINNNIIIGKNNALNVMHVKSAEFKNNTVYAGYVHFATSSLPALKSGQLDFKNNKYHTRKTNGIRILKYKDFNFANWKKAYGIDNDSQWKPLKNFSIEPVLKVSELETKTNCYNVAILSKEEKSATVNFSDFKIKEGASYKIYDVENRKKVIKSGKISSTKKITIPMDLKDLEKPLHNTIAIKSKKNFGVFRIEVEEMQKKVGFFERFFGWLF